MSRDPIGYSGVPSLYRAYFVLVGVDPSGTAGCKLVNLKIKKTLQLDLTDFANDNKKKEAIKKEVDKAMPLAEHDGIFPGFPADVGDFAGTSGFYIGYKLRAKVLRVSNSECCCDFSGSRLTFLAVAAVLSNTNSGVDTVFFGVDADGNPVSRNSPGDTLKHELWHTDGAFKGEYSSIEAELGKDIVHKRGFKYGATVAAMELHNCLVAVRDGATRDTTDEDCREGARKCISEFLTSPEAISRIKHHGSWHIKGTHPYDYYYDKF